MLRSGFITILLCLVEITSSRVASASDSTLARVPAWAKQAVWYQIFPERFRNGDTANDPKVTDIEGSWPHDVPKAWNISNWTGDWYALQPWEKKSKTRGFYYYAQQRRYGGDLQGVLDKLDYLKELGITAIYLNPIFESPSLHKYDAAMYHHIDNNFGPDPEGDKRMWMSENPADATTWVWTSADRLFLKLIEEAHRRDIKVIIDGVFNHVGLKFWAFHDVQARGEGSPYAGWFTINKFDDPSTTETEFDYVGWAGVRELPELRENENGLVGGLREHVHDVVKRWMDPNGDGNPSDGIDGWRLDVAEKVAIPFWREFRTWVRSINSQAYIVGEVWWEDWPNGKMFNASPWLQGDVFDAVMNYRLSREAGLFFKAKQNKISASEFDKRISALRSDYRNDANSVLMNLFDSHDIDRLSSQVVNPDTRYDNNVGVADNRNYLVRKPNAAEIQTQKLMVLFQMTYLGAPGIYYGDEAGMWGADDPDCRKPMLWSDLTYKVEKSHPFGKKRPADKNQFNQNLFSYYQKLISIRRSNPSLIWGDVTTLAVNDGSDMYAFTRMYTGNRVAVIMNNSTKKQSFTISLPQELRQYRWVNVLGDEEAELNEKLKETLLTVTLGPKSGAIFQLK